MLSVTEKGTPIQDGIKLQRLRQLLFQMMDSNGESIVNIKKVAAGCLPFRVTVVRQCLLISAAGYNLSSCFVGVCRSEARYITTGACTS